MSKNRYPSYESDDERKLRIAKAATAMTDEQVRRTQETMHRHTRFENPKRKGTRGAMARKAIREQGH